MQITKQKKPTQVQQKKTYQKNNEHMRQTFAKDNTSRPDWYEFIILLFIKNDLKTIIIAVSLSYLNNSCKNQK